MPQTVEIRVPDIGDFKDVPVVEVLVKPGDTVRVEDPLVTLESEKAAMEIPSPQAGVVESVTVKPGDKVSQGSVLVTVSAEETRAAEAPQVLSNTVAARPAPAAPPAAAQPTAAANGVVHASPSIRRFAREFGVDLHAVHGTGPHERITRDDVQMYVKHALETRSAPPSAFDLPPWPNVDFAVYGEIERVPLSRIRKLAGPNLHRNWLMIPHVTNNDEADITELEAFRKELNAENPGAKITLLAFLIRAVAAALAAYPEVNSSLDGDALVLKKYYNIGFAADTASGLVVPVLKGADRKGILAIAAETAELAAKARSGKLTLAEMQGATFTISSLGGIGGTSFTPIVNAPEVAILGVSRAAIRPLWNGSAFEPRLILPLSLSYDHRVVDGALAARFNAFLTKMLSDLRRAML